MDAATNSQVELKYNAAKSGLMIIKGNEENVKSFFASIKDLGRILHQKSVYLYPVIPYDLNDNIGYAASEANVSVWFFGDGGHGRRLWLNITGAAEDIEKFLTDISYMGRVERKNVAQRLNLDFQILKILDN